MEYSRLNLSIPTELKEYLTIAAAQESISRAETVSITEYLCGLIAADMKKNSDLSILSSEERKTHERPR